MWRAIWTQCNATQIARPPLLRHLSLLARPPPIFPNLLLVRFLAVKPSFPQLSEVSAASSESTTQLNNASHHENLPQLDECSNLQEVMESIKQQIMEDDRRRALQNPMPWMSLLSYPSRAAWRSTDHVLGSDPKSSETEDGLETAVVRSAGLSLLEQTQFNILQHSQKTNKQLKRTYTRILDVHQSLANKRERERRVAANLMTHIDDEDMKSEGSLEDSDGKHVGSWKAKKNLKPVIGSHCDDPSVLLILSKYMENSKKKKNNPTTSSNSEEFSTETPKINPRKIKLVSSTSSSNAKEKSVSYGPEQTMTNFRYRFGPNYSIVKRVLLEVQSLLGGKPPKSSGVRSSMDEGRPRGCFRPKRVLDFGSGVGSSSAAALDVFGVSRKNNIDNSDDSSGIDWIHSIDASQSMRDTTEKVLISVLEGVPWGYNQQQLEEELVDKNLESYERTLFNIKNSKIHEQSLERQRKREEKWKQSWTKNSNYRTRLTFGESIVDASSFFSDQVVDKDDRPKIPWQKQLEEQRQNVQEKKQTSQRGSFDLILCTYTLSELTSVSSSLTAAALLWEKLAPGGVMVLVEPGTPDGFSILRSVRSMLLECCPPLEISEESRSGQKIALIDQLNHEENADDHQLEEAVRQPEKLNDLWREECHVIAPCTHNGTCPMSRHVKNHVMRKNRSENAISSNSAAISDDANDDSAEEDMLMTDVMDENMSEEDLEKILSRMEKMETLDEENDADDSDDDERTNTDIDIDDFYHIDGTNTPTSTSTISQTDVFATGFCSFVHNFPGGTSRKRGEKFSYLVLQKRVPQGMNTSTYIDEGLCEGTDIVKMFAKAAHHAQERQQELLRMQLRRNKFIKNTDSKSDEVAEDSESDSPHETQLREILKQAVKIEDEYLDSRIDKLGLEFLHGDKRRRGWGRLIRAPLKKKGHVLLDYCSGGCSRTGCASSNSVSASSDGHATTGRAQGRIIRQKVSRGWSQRVAPGSYGAARKARWGGLWPDIISVETHE